MFVTIPPVLVYVSYNINQIYLAVFLGGPHHDNLYILMSLWFLGQIKFLLVTSIINSTFVKREGRDGTQALVAVLLMLWYTSVGIWTWTKGIWSGQKKKKSKQRVIKVTPRDESDSCFRELDGCGEQAALCNESCWLRPSPMFSSQSSVRFAALKSLLSSFVRKVGQQQSRGGGVGGTLKLHQELFFFQILMSVFC